MTNHLSPVTIPTKDPERHLVVNRVVYTDDNVVVSWRSDMEPGQRDAEGMTPANARLMASALIAAADVIDARLRELPEVWCANDEKPAVVFVETSRGGELPEKRALCGDCWWKAQSAAKVASR